VDTWGIDFGLLDKDGNLIGNPVNYRDLRIEGMMEAVFSRVPRKEVFAQTGIQFMPINTLYQMMSLVECKSPQMEIATTFLTAPDLLNYWLTGVKVSEFSNATTTQMFNPRTGDWAMAMLDRLGIPTNIFPEIVLPGTKLGVYEGIPVTVPACHDTGSSVAAVPTSSTNYAYISSGTWSLVGLEVSEPVINEAAFDANATNEGGVYGTFRFLKNVMGLWIFQQCRETWVASGDPLGYRDLVQLAHSAPPLQSIINPDDARLLPSGDHPSIIRDMCMETGQPAPETKGALIRCVLESLALKHRDVIETLSNIVGKSVEVIHIVGGGKQNDLLNQMTADATGIPVVTGPIEATVIGNALVQMIALGELGNIEEGRELVQHSFELEPFEPGEKEPWDEMYQKHYA